MRWITAVVIVCLSATWVGVALAAEEKSGIGGIVEIRGFHIDFRLVNERKMKSILPSLNTQIDIIERAQVPDDVLQFFRTIPIIVDPKLEGSKGHAQRLEGQQTVTVQAIKLPSDRPILLHELIHGYFAVKLRGHTPQIPAAFREAQNSDYYPRTFSNAHFMENPNEFFTIVSSTLLFGKIDQAPYTCAVIHKHQPEFIAFIETQFGSHECK